MASVDWERIAYEIQCLSIGVCPGCTWAVHSGACPGKNAPSDMTLEVPRYVPKLTGHTTLEDLFKERGDKKCSSD